MAAIVHSTNIHPLSEVRGSLPLINPEPKDGWEFATDKPRAPEHEPQGLRIYQWQTSSDLAWTQVVYMLNTYTYVCICNTLTPQIKECQNPYYITYNTDN